MSTGIWAVQLASLAGVRSNIGKCVARCMKLVDGRMLTRTWKLIKPRGEILRLGSDFLRDETRDTP
jgi:hypothetical protein